MVVLDRLVLLAAYTVLAGFCGFGIVVAVTMITDRQTRRAFLRFWGWRR